MVEDMESVGVVLEQEVAGAAEVEAEAAIQDKMRRRPLGNLQLPRLLNLPGKMPMQHPKSFSLKAMLE